MNTLIGEFTTDVFVANTAGNREDLASTFLPMNGQCNKNDTSAVNIPA